MSILRRDNKEPLNLVQLALPFGLVIYQVYVIPRLLAITARIERRAVAGRWVRYVVDRPLYLAY